MSGDSQAQHECSETTPLLSQSSGKDCNADSPEKAPFSIGFDKIAAAGIGLAASLVYIALSASMILFNKFLMKPDVFPFPVALASMHSLFALFLATSLLRLSPDLFPSYSRVFETKSEDIELATPVNGKLTQHLKALLPFAPLAVCCSLALICGNSAYRYASVSFLQMIKESHIMFVYILMLLAGLESFKLRMAAVITFVACSAMVAVYGEIHFSWQGLCLQLASGLSGSAHIVLSNLLMARPSMGKVDPLTLVLCTAPLMLLILIPVNVAFWSPAIPMLLRQWLPVLAANSCLAFLLQTSSATLIWVTSGTGYALACVAKDLAIVAAAQFILQDSFTLLQVVGFGGAISGMMLYSAMKLFPEKFE